MMKIWKKTNNSQWFSKMNVTTAITKPTVIRIPGLRKHQQKMTVVTLNLKLT